MDVQHAIMKGFDENGGENTHITRQADQVDLLVLAKVEDLFVVLFSCSRVALTGDRNRLDAVGLGPFQGLHVLHIGEDQGELGLDGLGFPGID